MKRIFGGLLVAALLLPLRADALRVQEFLAICEQSGRACEEIPILQAYIGGALDLVAMLHEETDYIETMYCKDTKILFDVSGIIRFIEANAEGNEEKNAMMMLIRFLETYGGC